MLLQTSLLTQSQIPKLHFNFRMMKKIVLTALPTCLLVLQLMAQFRTPAVTDMRFGFQVSPTLSWLDTDDNTINNNGMRPGIRLGVLGEFYFRENYAFTLGLGYAFGQGGRLLHDLPGDYWNQTAALEGIDSMGAGTDLYYSVQLIEIPVGLRMQSREFGYIRYFLEPHLLFSIRNQAAGRLDAPAFDFDMLDISEEVAGLLLSWGIGGGLEYSITQSNTLLGGLYFQRLINDFTHDTGTIHHPELGTFVEDSKATLFALTLRAALMF